MTDKKKNLKANCPKCGEEQNEPMVVSSSTDKIDKNDTTITITGKTITITDKMNIIDTLKVVKHSIPAWGYLCTKCDIIFATSQKKIGAISRKDLLEKKTKGEINE